jgi:hypothetical protein
MDRRQSFNRASAQAAAAFLDKIVADMPFPVKAIQVDGGSEFMAEFEVACQTKGIALYVLPPRSPQMSGAVERCNGAWRYEFYETYDLPSGVNQLNPILDSYRTSTTSIDPTEPLPKNPSPVSRSPISQDTHDVPYVLSPDTALTRISKRPTLATAH